MSCCNPLTHITATDLFLCIFDCIYYVLTKHQHDCVVISPVNPEDFIQMIFLSADGNAQHQACQISCQLQRYQNQDTYYSDLDTRWQGQIIHWQNRCGWNILSKMWPSGQDDWSCKLLQTALTVLPVPPTRRLGTTTMTVTTTVLERTRTTAGKAAREDIIQHCFWTG